MRATPQARLLAAVVDVLDRYWGPIGVAVVVVLEVFVFAPRQSPLAMLLGGIVGAALLTAWLGGGSGWRPR